MATSGNTGSPFFLPYPLGSDLMTLTADVTNIVESIEAVLDTDLLKLSGGTLTGPLIISDATTSLTAAGDINIAGGVIGEFLELNTGSPFHTAVEGQMAWNDEEGTFDLGLKNSVTYEMGMKLFMPPTKNNSGAQINKGEFVMATGAQGDRITIAKAVTDGSIDPQYMIGVAADDIPNGSENGLIIVNGTVKEIDTDAFPIGTILYPDPLTAGALTDTQPDAPNIRTSIAIVLRQHVNTGRIYVRMTNGSVLGGTDSNVKFGSLAEDDIIVYDDVNNIWVNKNIGTAITDVGSITLSDSLTMSDPSVGIVMGSGGPKVLSGSGSPEGVVTAEVGSIWMRTDGGVGTTIYYKVTGTGNIGWYSANSTSADVVGPASSTDNEIVRFDGTTGKNVHGTGGKFIVDDDGNIDSDGGGAFAGDLTISKATPRLTLGSTGASTRYFKIETSSAARWLFGGNGDAESGTNAGTNFVVHAYSDAGAFLSTPLTITRSTGLTTLTGDLTISKATPTLLVNASSGTGVADISAADGSIASFRLKTAGSLRWDIRKNATVESGGASGYSGSDLEIYGYQNSGSGAYKVVGMERATGNVSFTYNTIHQAGARLGSSTGVLLRSGTGSPEGAVTAPVGSIWFQTDSTVGVTHWKKASGTGNTGWVVMQGDTGWRKCVVTDTDIFSNDTYNTANPNSTLHIRRVNDTVHWRFAVNSSPTFATAYQVVFGVPTGFRPLSFSTPTGTTGPWVAAHDGANGQPTTRGLYQTANTSSTWLTSAAWAGGVGYVANTTYTTSESWPTSLPGSAV